MRKYSAILLTAAFCLSLTACGGRREEYAAEAVTTEASFAQTSSTTEETLSDEELEECLLVWGEVQAALSAWLESADQRGLTLEEKKEECYALLVDLARNGTEKAPYSLIVEHSVYFDESAPTRYSFSYSCGGSGGIMLEPFPEGLN